ncbi:DUF1134 domain-containing protein [Aurantiacibacter hainanensis]|uniref:DUF1134 domain-containing protein n=1 Tax=Aurantiacibacter hainanensis TaxID=3076114 RepID=UPI0030C6886F
MRPIRKAIAAAALSALAALSLPAAAQQIETVDPDTMIDGDLVDPPSRSSAEPGFEGTYDAGEPGDRYDSGPTGELPPVDPSRDAPASAAAPVAGPAATTATQAAPATQTAATAQAQPTYAEDDLIGAAEGLFGRGAEGLARLIQDILSEQGEPNGYIVGREAGGAFVVGVRYGSGTLHHKVEGNMPVYWTGPSIGLDAGANAGNTFVLVYNLHDTDELYERFPAGEGQAYLVGGFNASYVRKGDVVLIPIRVGAGLRLGVNAGYMRFSRNQRWLPF